MIPFSSFRPRLRDYSVAAILLTGTADALFFGSLGRPVGLPVALFVALVAIAAAVCNRRGLGRASAVPALLLAGAFLMLVENVDWKSLGVAATCLAGFALAAAGRLPSGFGAVSGLARFMEAAPLALVRDDRRRRRAGRRVPGSTRPIRDRALVWAVWVMPLTLALGFVLLLGSGNPILGRWLVLIDPFVLLKLLDPVRLLFWTLVLASVWPFLRPRLRHVRPGKVIGAPATAAVALEQADALATWSAHVFGPAAILRALLLFNAVFGVQTVLDALYLWGGTELPEGIGYAAYAHRGAYTLVVTALLAAAFVLVAMRPGTKAAADRRIRALVYLWTGQNVALVLSAMLRLDLYVDAYALTHLRLAAFAWMALVAVGLVLIVVSIAQTRSHRWLVGSNMTAAAAMLGTSCLIDPSALIARFNVDHSREVSGSGTRLDTRHLLSLGPAAIPAIDRFLVLVDGPSGLQDDRPHPSGILRSYRNILTFEHRGLMHDWHAWTFRNWRLSRYLDTHAVPLARVPPGPALPPANGSK